MALRGDYLACPVCNLGGKNPKLMKDHVRKYHKGMMLQKPKLCNLHGKSPGRSFGSSRIEVKCEQFYHSFSESDTNGFLTDRIQTDTLHIGPV